VSDYTIAALLLASLVALAVAAPIWGVDSRDGIDSDQSARRVAWLQANADTVVFGKTAVRAGGRSVGVVVAGVLRHAAQRLDRDADDNNEQGRRIVLA
jgi:hypothetical protein